MHVNNRFVVIIIKIILCFIVIVKSYPTDFTPIVNTTLGQINGSVMTSRLGNTFLAFRGIRYGLAPIGDLRFQAPQPVTSWTDDVFDATNDGPLCPQPFMDKTKVSEDCLRINVFTNSLPNNSSDNKKPVLFFIPGGGFYTGSGVSTHYGGPQYLMDRDIVLVTMNYRLGSLGFMSLGTEYCPGNAGFKDQVLGMKWVRDHIESFGGDPNLVTIIGNSAGGLSVVYHMISPMSRGLFHRAIAMSGAIVPQPYYKADQINVAKRQARIMKCPEEPLENLFHCLKSASSEEMTEKLSLMFDMDQDMPGLPWSSVIEPDFGQERFLVEDPIISLKKGNYSHVPIILGVTKDELISSAVGYIKNETKLNQLDQEFDKYVPICVGYERGTEISKNITTTVRDFYNLTTPLTKDHLTDLNHLFSDSVLGFGAHRLMQLLYNYTDVYYYKHTYQGRYSHFYYPADKPYGVAHSDDLLYLYVRIFAPMYISTDPESLNVERMTRMWTNFALKGNPNNPEDEIISDLSWKPVEHLHEYYLDIGNTLELKEGLFKDRYEVWDRLYPLFN